MLSIARILRSAGSASVRLCGGEPLLDEQELYLTPNPDNISPCMYEPWRITLTWIEHLLIPVLDLRRCLPLRYLCICVVLYFVYFVGC